MIPSGVQYRKDSSGMNRSLPLSMIIAICFFSISTGAMNIAGIPQTVLLSILVSSVMLLRLRFALSRHGVMIAAAILLSFAPGLLSAVAFGRVEVLSLINLFSSLLVFVVAFSFVQEYLSLADERTLVWLRRFIWAVLLFAAFETFNYEQILSLRSLYYGEALSYFHPRDLALYGLPRPTALFSEPSNFARFLSLMFALYYALSRNLLGTSGLFLVGFLIVRSPVLLYAIPACILIYWVTKSPWRGVLRRLSPGLRAIVLGLGALIFTLIFVVSQYSRIKDVLAGRDGSFDGRIGLPIRFMAENWSSPILGLGPTPLSEINAYVNAIYIAEGNRNWLIGQDFTVGLSPAFVLIIGLGAVGLLVLVGTLYATLGRRGVASFFVLFFCNVFGTGMNAPAMYVPMAVVLSTCWSIWLRGSGRDALPRPGSRA